MYRRGPFWGGPYMRRRGFPLFPMGGYGMGMGMGGLLGNMVAGGIGYMIGKQSAQQAQQYQPPNTRDRPNNIRRRSTSRHKRRSTRHQRSRPTSKQLLPVVETKDLRSSNYLDTCAIPVS